MIYFLLDLLFYKFFHLNFYFILLNFRNKINFYQLTFMIFLLYIIFKSYYPFIILPIMYFYNNVININKNIINYIFYNILNFVVFTHFSFSWFSFLLFLSIIILCYIYYDSNIEYVRWNNGKFRNYRKKRKKKKILK
jgi:hypothetical protein